MSNSIYKLLKVAPGFILRELSLMNLHTRGKHVEEKKITNCKAVKLKSTFYIGKTEIS